MIEFRPLTKPGQVSHGLNLILRLRNPLEMPRLMFQLLEGQAGVQAALDELHFVHYARFLPSPDGSALEVITEFDGPLAAYVMDFAVAIGDVFSLILGYVEHAPPLPVAEHPDEFWDFVQRNNRVRILGAPIPGFIDYPVYSAYPTATVLDIVGPRTRLPPPVADRHAAPIDLSDVQGNILQGYRARMARHLLLAVRDPARAGAWFAALAEPGKKGPLALTTAERWEGKAKPATALNLSFTHAGLAALGVERGELARFPAAFREGPAEPDRAAANGDVDASAPANWRLGRRPDEHAMLSLYAFTGQEAAFEAASVAIREALGDAGLALVSEHDCRALLDAHGQQTDRVHFGFVDGIAQPRISGQDLTVDDMQPAASPGEFLMGAQYRDIFGGPSIGALPATLATNGTFCAVRLLEQDVAGFEAVLDQTAQAHGVAREWVAAKLMGRWRGGASMALFPNEAPPEGDTPSNFFDYAPSAEYPQPVNDHAGLACPVGAHVRRVNPRTSRIAGVRHGRRLIRRGMPYTLSRPGAAPEHGIFGMFICGSLERQFEFIQQQWINGSVFTSGLRGTQDPIAGAQTTGGRFTIPMADGPAIELSLPRLTTTRGSLYLFMPGLAAIRSLAAVGAEAGSALHRVQDFAYQVRDTLTAELKHSLVACLSRLKPTLAKPAPEGGPLPGGFDPDAFDPKDPAFLADPYPVFAQFRQYRPVHFVPAHQAYWVFTHELVSQLFADNERFLKLPSDSAEPRGLFTMDPPRHTVVRSLMNGAFATAIANASETAAQVCERVLADIRDTRFDFVDAYARRVPLEVFVAIAGVPPGRQAKLDTLARKVMTHADHTLDEVQQAMGKAAAVELVAELGLMLPEALLHPSGTLLHAIARLTASGQLHLSEALATLLHFTLGGYLSTEFLLCTGVRNLLLDDRRAWLGLDPQVNPGDALINEMRRHEAPLGVIDRYAAQDMHFGGLMIPKNGRLMGLLGSANHDPRVFGPEADRFRPENPPAMNLALGAGIHMCIGAPLQARVMPIAIGALKRRFPGLALASSAQPPWSPDPYFRTFSSLPVTA